MKFKCKKCEKELNEYEIFKEEPSVFCNSCFKIWLNENSDSIINQYICWKISHSLNDLIQPERLNDSTPQGDAIV